MTKYSLEEKEDQREKMSSHYCYMRLCVNEFNIAKKPLFLSCGKVAHALTLVLHTHWCLTAAHVGTGLSGMVIPVPQRAAETQ